MIKMNKDGARRAVLALLLTGVSAPALAQEAQPISGDDIVVTAQKRSERLQDVPIAVSALGGDALDNSTSSA